jgi:hypothetical protein
MSYMANDIDPELSALAAIAEFRTWLHSSGRGYLEDGLGHLSPGDAFKELFRRAGVPISPSDSVLKTIHKARAHIEANCPPRKPH